MHTDDTLDQFDRDLDQLTWDSGDASSVNGEVAVLLAAAGAVHALDAADVQPDPNPGFLRDLEEMLATHAPIPLMTATACRPCTGQAMGVEIWETGAALRRR